MSLSLFFATTIKRIPYLDLIAPIEEAALNILQARADELRWKVRQVLEKSKPPNPNITNEERLAIKSLQCDESIIILPADKGNTTVVMDRVEYSNKLADLIENGGYCKVKKNPNLKTKRKLSQILSKNKDLIPQRKYRQLIQHYSKLPHIYGLPKIHKDGIPLRPIVHCRGSACHPLSCYLVKIVNPLRGKSSSYVRNSTHFVEKIRNAPIHSNQIVSLFTKVPTDETLAVVQDMLAVDSSLEERTCISIDNLMEMLTFCVETTYFEMVLTYTIKWRAWRWDLHCPQCWPIYMEYFEEMALGSIPLNPLMWLRYIDDTFILWPHQEDVQILMNHVNSIRPSIQFTMEKEQDNKLSFLDVLITHTEHGFCTSVYHKPTFTGHYLNFHSHHPYNVKKGIVCCLQHRAKAISSDEVYQKEMDSLKETLYQNNYPESITSATINLDHKTEEDTPKLTTVCLPYVRGLTEKIRKIWNPYDIRMTFRSESTLRRHLLRVKPPTENHMTKNCVYSIPCSCGKVYKCETCRPLKVRLEEHHKAVVRGEIEKLSMADHIWREKGNHLPLWEEVEIIDREENWKRRCLKEFAHMIGYSNSNLLSRPSIEMNTILEPIIKKVRLHRKKKKKRKKLNWLMF